MLKVRTLFLSRTSFGFRVPEVDADSIKRLISVGLPAPYPEVLIASSRLVYPELLAEVYTLHYTVQPWIF